TASAMPTTFTLAAAAAASLGAQYPHATTAPPVGSTKVRSAFEVLGVGPPARTAVNLDQGERFIQAISGEKRPLPTWNGQPATMRSWLKLLAYWEIESTVPREKWGLRLYQSFPEGSKPRQIADQIGMQELLSADGYSLVLSSIIAKYRPFLEVAGPAAIDRFLYTGERAKGESFANYIAGKEVARQEVESHLQERLNDKVAGRVLLRQADLTEFQRELLALRDHSQLLTFDQVAAILRPLDRPELLAQAAGTSLGQAATRSYPVMNRDSMEGDFEENDDQDEPNDDDNDESAESESQTSQDDDDLTFEDKVYDEEGAIYIQAYHTAYSDVRRDLRDRKKDQKANGNKASPNLIKGKPEDLAARTRCYNCQELGHFARDCPLKGGGKGNSKSDNKKVNFIVSRGSGTGGSSVFMTFPTKALSCATPSPEHLQVFAGVRVKGCEAIVDTAAEDAVIGSQALEQLQEALKKHFLQTVHVKSENQIPCAGIGGEATALGLVDVPTSIAGLHGVLRFTVLQDSASFQTPPLLPISYLEAVGAILDFGRDSYSTSDGYCAPMIRLPSGHRVIDILRFDRRSIGIYKCFDVGTREDVKVEFRGFMDMRFFDFGGFDFGGFIGMRHFDFYDFHAVSYVGSGRANIPESFETSYKGMNVIASVGPFSGGELWLAKDLPDIGCPRAKKVGNKIVKGTAIDVKNRIFEFSPKDRRATLPWKGSKKTVTFYTIRDSFRLSADQWKMLKEAGFQVQNMSKPTFFQLQDGDCEEEEASCVHEQRVRWPIANMLKHLSSWIQMVEEEYPEPQPQRRMGTQRALATWKRMAQTILLMLATARQQMVVDQLVKKNNEPELNPPSSSTSSFKGQKKAKDAPVNQGLGKPLTRSKAHAKFNKEPSECNRRSDALRCRANSKATWWTCTDCGSRWQRPEEDPSSTATTSFQVDEKAKKVKNAQGQEFPKFLPAPRGVTATDHVHVDGTTGKGEVPSSSQGGGDAPWWRTLFADRSLSSKDDLIRTSSSTAVKDADAETWEINTDDETVDAEMPAVKAEE
ncbi:unnamed protein product, partial [Symbiodinium pilosum]